MMAANYRHIGGGENRLGRHYSRFAGIWPTSFLADQSLTLRKSQNAGSNRPSRAKPDPRELTTLRNAYDSLANALAPLTDQQVHELIEQITAEIGLKQ